MDAQFERTFGRACRETGEQADVLDEHARFKVYRVMVDDPRHHRLLIDCLTGEPDEALRTSALVLLAEAAPADMRAAISSAATATGRAFVDTRLSEIALLEHVVGGAFDDTVQSAVRHASNWLQRRVVEDSSNVPVLALLAEEGRTRKVRAAAARRRDELSTNGLAAET